MKFRKKPIVIDAIQLTWDNWNKVCEFVSEEYFGGGFNPDNDIDKVGLKIKTLEGTMDAVQNDWIIKGVNGEFYPCKPDIFEKTYELLI
jgi:hypothetical protein